MLTADRQVRPQKDASLLRDIPAETAVIRTRTGEPGPESRALHRLVVSCLHTPLSIPDSGNLWLPWAFPAALRELQRRPIKAIYATGDPFSSHILGAILKAKTKLPLVLDYRDEWTLDPVYLANQSRHRAWFQFIERRQQRYVIGKAERVMVVTDRRATHLLRNTARLTSFSRYETGMIPKTSRLRSTRD